MAVKRSKSNKKVGLALGSGAARGIAHIGVLKVLEEEKIPVDMIAGTSSGAFIGAVYARGRDVSQITEIARSIGRKKFSLLFDPVLPKTSLVRGKKIEGEMKSIFKDIRFEDLVMPFACVATEIETGEEVVIRQGKVWEAIRASISIPVILAPVTREGRHLVDGLLVNPVPVNILKEMGADIIIAVNVLQYKEIPGDDEPNIFEVIMQIIHISSHRIIAHSLEGADIVIEPQVLDIGYADLQRVDDCISRGESAAREVIPDIKRLI